MSLIKMCFPNEVEEVTTIIDYDDNGKETKKRVIKTTKKIEPNIAAVNVILDNYESEPMLKEIIEKLKKIKEEYDK